MSANDDIQFDRAEFNTDSAATCAECGTPLARFYYEANSQTVCEACRYAIETRFNGGSGIGRFARAAAFGLIAAAVGFGIYYGIAALTGYEFGLIAIVVGFMVGTAVRIGSRGRGGWIYQTLAIVLTYLAIVSTYIPPLVKGLKEAARQEQAQLTAASTTSAVQATPASASNGAGPAQPDPATSLPRPVGMAIGLAILLAIACIAPFLAGFQNIMGIVIIGIGIFEAWKLNRRGELVITGPHAIATIAATGA